MLTKADINKIVKVHYKRRKNIEHELTGIVSKVRKQSFILLINNEKPLSIGFRNIKELNYV